MDRLTRDEGIDGTPALLLAAVGLFLYNALFHLVPAPVATIVGPLACDGEPSYRYAGGQPVR